jgi:hypothetical protein
VVTPQHVPHLFHVMPRSSPGRELPLWRGGLVARGLGGDVALVPGAFTAMPARARSIAIVATTVFVNVSITDTLLPLEFEMYA